MQSLKSISIYLYEITQVKCSSIFLLIKSKKISILRLKIVFSFCIVIRYNILLKLLVITSTHGIRIINFLICYRFNKALLSVSYVFK
jgi:hypothetical protein